MYEIAKVAVKKSKAKEFKTIQTQKNRFNNHSSPLDQILFLQRTIGNQAVESLLKSGIIQAKLKIGKPNDIYEQEADRVAEQIVSSSWSVVNNQKEEGEIQRQTEEEERKREEEGETFQLKKMQGNIPEVTPDIEFRIRALRGSGQPLPKSIRAFFESRFGYDFSHVRIHTDPEAAKLARALNAEAFTYGRDIYFGEGKYNPNTLTGKRLLAHKLVHVVQQGNTNFPTLQWKVSDATNEKASQSEKLCDMMGNEIYSGKKEEIIKKINDDISKLPNIVRKQLNYKFKNYCEFLISMPRYVDNPIQHFKKIRKAEVPGKVWLHEIAATRLEEVKELVKDEMPATTVALGLRGRYKPHLRESKSMMAHPLGYAVDYRAIKNPMIKDQKLVKLIEIITGQSISINLGLRWSKRREEIKECGKIEIKNLEDVNKCNEIMFKKLEQEYDRLVEASKFFRRKKLGEVREKIEEIKKEIKKKNNRLKILERKLKRLKRKKKDTKSIEEEIAKYSEQKQFLEEEKKTLEDKIPDILEESRKSMLTKIGEEKSLISQEVTRCEETFGKLLPQTQKELKKEKRKLTGEKKRKEKLIKRQKGRLEKAQEKLNRLEEQIEKFTAKIKTSEKKLERKKKEREKLIKKINELKEQLKKLTTDLNNIETQLKCISKKKELNILNELENHLTNLEPVIGKRKAQNPAVWQLIELGYFNPDPERPQNISHKPWKYGFNLLFIKAMMKRGFDWGATWSPGSTDPMHFELVEGVESIKTPPKKISKPIRRCSIELCKELSKIAEGKK